MGERTYLNKTMLQTAGTSTPVVSKSTVVAMKWDRDASEQVDGDEGLTRAGGQREQRALLAARELLQDSPDRGILIVAASGFTAAVAREQRTRARRVELEAHTLLIPGAQIVGPGKL